MRAKRKQRMALVALLVIGISGATALGLYAFQQNLLYFYSPTQVLAGKAPLGQHIRIGGLVVDGSVKHSPHSLKVRFSLTDKDSTIPLVYSGLLPDLFREGQGIVAHGRMLGDGVFKADQVLAKHDSKYMPPAVADELKTADNQSKTDAHGGLKTAANKAQAATHNDGYPR